MSEKNALAEEARKNVLSRLRKIEGQIRAVHAMVEQGRRCEDVLVQIRAVKAAMRSMTSLIVKTYLGACFQGAAASSARTEEDVRQLEETIAVLAKFIED